MKRLLLLITICISSVSFGQLLNLEWIKPTGFSDMVMTDDGDFIGCSGAETIKLNPYGDTIWTIPSSGTTSIDKLNDGNFILAGGINSDYLLMKIDLNGTVIWQSQFGGSNNDKVNSVCGTSDGGFIFTGITNGINVWPNLPEEISNIGVVKFDASGNIEWQNSFGGSSEDVGESIMELENGGYILSGFTFSDDGDVTFNNGDYDFWIIRLDSFGNLLWQKTLGGPAIDKSFAIETTDDGGFIVAGHAGGIGGDVSEIYGTQFPTDSWVVKLDDNGNLLWEHNYGGTSVDRVDDMVRTNLGMYVIVGKTRSTDIDISNDESGASSTIYLPWIFIIDSFGNILYSYKHNPFEVVNNSNFRCVISNGKDIYASAGLDLFKFGFPDVYGFVFSDINPNCILENFESGVEGMNILLEPGSIIANSNSDGYWYVDSLPSGSYSVIIDSTTQWISNCFQNLSFDHDDQELSIITEIGLTDPFPCIEPDVSIFAPSLRRCANDRLVFVSACNQATATGILDSSYVDVELDPLLTVNSASLPYTDIGNNTFRFETGDILPGQCVNFTLSTAVSCDAQNGQTLCMEATLYPAEDCIFDSIPSDPITNDGIGGTLDGLPGPCTLPWDKSSLQVEGWCQGDSVYFSVTNTGDFGDGDMECYSPVWLTVDGVVTDTDSLQIQGGETVIYSYPASGQTFILNASQHPLHPGNSAPNAHVELCGDSTNWTPGIINQFPQDDADPDVDIYCGQVTAPLDPNDKTGYPLGQTEEYYIQPNQQLQYVIRFQNVGTDTAFTVVVRDTLDIDLNIFTVTPGVASDPYTFKMYGPRVLEWTFEDIQLPDSTTNSEGSNGFLTFHVEQVPDLAPGTVINNDADIYFDFELPITTNTTVHKIFEGFVEVLNIEDLTIEGKEIFMYPNPTSNLITIQSESVLNNKFKIYDQQGREVMNGKLTGKNTEVSLGTLSRGTYTIQVDGNYKPAVIVKQ